MRGSGWGLAAFGSILWIATVAWPLLAGGGLVLARDGDPAVAFASPHSLVSIFGSTCLYAAGIALACVIVGWAPGRVLGRAMHHSRRVAIATLLFVPICLPAYVVFYMWWQSWPADSALYAWAVENRLVPLLRRVTLVLGMVCWGWPVVAWSVAGVVAALPREREALLAIDAVGPTGRTIDRLRTDGAGLAVGGLFVFLLVWSDTTSFDLAQVFTFGNELRGARDALGEPPREVLLAAWPAILVAMVGAAAAWLLIERRPRVRPGANDSASRGARVATAVVWCVSVVVPGLLLLNGLMTAGGLSSRLGPFVELYGSSLGRSVAGAAATSILVGVIALALAAQWSDHRRWVRTLAHVQAVTWLFVALVPAPCIAVILEAAYNRVGPFGGPPLAGDPQGLDLSLSTVIYRQPVILVLAHIARFGFVAGLLGRWAARGESEALRDLRHVDGAATLRTWWQAGRPRLIGAAVATAAVTFVLALGEIPMTARLHPPGSDPIAVRLLNAMHYQRPEPVLLLAGLLMLGALVAAGVVAVFVGLGSQRRVAVVRGLGLILAAITLVGCTPAESSEDTRLRTRGTYGGSGTALGQFSYPRCIASDEERGFVYVIDKTARVQRFDIDGEPTGQWRMPEKENGKPTGISVAPDGRVFVADTHYYRVIAFDMDGRELMRFGEYGEGPGQFIYTTDVAFGADGRLYVAEYGGNDRIQVFHPDGRFDFAFGSFGDEPDGEEPVLNRPQAIAFDRNREELFIADACHHRIVVTDARGRVLRSFGGAGVGEGEMHYPYGLQVLDDGSLLVCEFGNNRLQQFDGDGRPRRRLGRLGAAEGELRYPWSLAIADDLVFILDSGNNRIQTIRVP